MDGLQCIYNKINIEMLKIKKSLIFTIFLTSVVSVKSNAMEVGKDYIKAGIGYSFNKFTSDRNKNTLKGFNYEVGIGAVFSKKIRTDLELQLNNGNKNSKENLTLEEYNILAKDMAKRPSISKGSDISYDSKVYHKKVGIIFNLYYDFDKINIIEPYVFGGIGYIRSSIKEKGNFIITNKTTGTSTNASNEISSKGLNSLAYQIGLGLGYEMYQNVYLDFNYKLSSITGTYRTKSINNGPVKEMAKPQLQHTLMLGIRVSLA